MFGTSLLKRSPVPQSKEGKGKKFAALENPFKKTDIFMIKSQLSFSKICLMEEITEKYSRKERIFNADVTLLVLEN